MDQLDEDYFMQGSAPAGAAAHPLLPPIGPRPRPNGETYHPRQIGSFEDLALLRAIREQGQHVLLGGPPGCGKTAAVEAAFRSHDGPGLLTLVGSADTTTADLLGSYLPNPDPATVTTSPYVWVHGPLTLAVMCGLPLLLDEVTMIDPRVLIPLYEVMDGRGELRIPGTNLPAIPVARGFMVCATHNPDVPGAVLSEALRDRFTHHWQVESDWQLARDLGVPTEIVKVAQNLDRARQRSELSWSPQLRSLLDFRDMANLYGKEYAAGTLVAKAPAHDRDQILEAIQQLYPTVTVTQFGGRYGA
ncbi:MoxR family ATPase [Microbispora sp. NBRC 16548]|uniref:AAA family ATPase n=1 Tax=Microbispora sp. NBRC 16548 TaxID=3030994 RepID=UPI00161B3797|nr:MoxR family ATPase [Microbispora sp. NBRC 16548]GLX06699.1 hypothetical protein Misp03_36260 [Microbispora sp. NBRC 16548]